MKKYKVKTPNTSFGGKRHGVQFYRGEAEAEMTEAVAKEFKSWGYEVVEIKEKKAPAKKTTTKKTQTKKTK